MSIYSTNRAGTVASVEVVANESYRASDIGRIMYESQVNDQALFEATLAADFSEIAGLREGTLLESEIAAFNEANTKSFFATLKEKLAAFWAKIKGVFKAAIQKIAAYVLRDGKAFVKEFEAVEAKGKRFVGKIEDAAYIFNGDAVELPKVADAEKYVASHKEGDMPNSKEIVNSVLGAEDAASYKKAAVEKLIGKKTIDNHDKAAVEVMKKNLSGGSDLIKGLRDEEKRVNSGLADLKKIIEETERNCLAANKDAKKEDKDNTANAIKRATVILGAYETVVSTMTSVKIAAAKTVITNSRKILAKMLSDMKGGSEAQHEAAAITAEDEVETALDDDLATPADDETQKEIDELVAEA